MSNEVVGQTLAPQTEAPVVTTTTTTTTPVTPITSDDAVVIIRTATLIVLLVLSLIGNALVVLSVAQARSSRYIPFNSFVLSLASFCLLECASTMSLATGFSIEKQWNFGDFMAGFNAAFIQLQNVGVLLTIAVMSIDRFVAVTKFTKYHSQASKHKANYVALYTWVHALLFSLPLLFQNQTIGITCRAFVERCLCGLVEGTSLVYTSLLFGVCFAIPFLILIVFLILARKKAFKERNRIKSNNSPEHATYCLKESVILKEAGWCKYVVMLFVLFLFFKSPYIIVDLLTQQNLTLVFEPEATADGARFYYQTALSWMMFCFSAIFPVLTFIQFPDHWRKMKSYITCTPTTTSAANGGPLTRSQRQRQRRQRQREKIAIRNARNKKLKSVANKSSIKASAGAPSTISTNITSEKIAVPTAGELLFRVPVLYAANDGLHLIASHKMLTTKDDTIMYKKNSNTSSNNPKSEAKRFNISSNQISQVSSDVIGEFRPSSVVDKRVDVSGSRDGLDDDIAYINSAHQNDFDFDDTDSELNESVNSRTHIWPHARSRAAASASSVKVKDYATKSGLEEMHGQSCMELIRPSRRHHVPLVESQDDEVPPHPHTPSPPPDDSAFRASSPTSIAFGETSIDENVMQKPTLSRVRLPAIGRNIPVAFAKPNQSRKERLLSPAASSDSSEHYSSSRGSSVCAAAKQNLALAANRVFPNQSKAFLNDDLVLQDADSSRDISPSHFPVKALDSEPNKTPLKAASRKATRLVAQHIAHYRRPSLASGGSTKIK